MEPFQFHPYNYCYRSMRVGRAEKAGTIRNYRGLAIKSTVHFWRSLNKEQFTGVEQQLRTPSTHARTYGNIILFLLLSANIMLARCSDSRFPRTGNDHIYISEMYALIRIELPALVKFYRRP